MHAMLKLDGVCDRLRELNKTYHNSLTQVAFTKLSLDLYMKLLCISGIFESIELLLCTKYKCFRQKISAQHESGLRDGDSSLES